MRIALGTTSENKIKYLKDSLSFFEYNDYSLTIQKVDSGVEHQPTSRDETIQGAKNRAIAALNKDKQADIGIGLEGGIEVIDGNCYYICIAATYNNKGYKIGISSMLKLPEVVGSKVQAYNVDVSSELQAYSPETPNQAFLKQMILSREEMFFEALRNVMLEILH